MPAKSFFAILPAGGEGGHGHWDGAKTVPTSSTGAHVSAGASPARYAMHLSSGVLARGSHARQPPDSLVLGLACAKPGDGGPTGAARPPRAGKRERARMRRHRAVSPAPGSSNLLPAEEVQSSVSLRQQLPTRRLPPVTAQRPEARTTSRGRDVNTPPTPKAPQILAKMRAETAPDVLRRVLADPEDGLPNDAELTEIYLRYERGLPLSFRQQIWLDATSDVETRPYVTLGDQCAPPPRPASVDPVLPPPFYYKPILGCGDFANCADCRTRYNLPANYTPPSTDGRARNATEFLQRFFDGTKKLVKHIQHLRDQEGEDAVARMFDSDEDLPEHVCPVHPEAAPAAASSEGEGAGAGDNATMTEQEALTTIYSRLVLVQSVSDFNMRRALQVAAPHTRPWTLSRQGLVDAITRIRKRLAIQDSIEARVIRGEETEAIVDAVRSRGLVVSLPLIGRKAFMQLSNVGLGRAVRERSRVLIYEADEASSASGERPRGDAVEEITVGSSMRVEVLKISPLTKMMIEVSRRAVLLRRQRPESDIAADLIQIDRAIDALSAWQRAALPELAGRRRRGSVRRQRTRKRAAAEAATGEPLVA